MESRHAVYLVNSDEAMVKPLLLLLALVGFNGSVIVEEAAESPQRQIPTTIADSPTRTAPAPVSSVPAPTPSTEGHQPLLLLYEQNPWLTVIGSDSPTFALYADGRVVYWEETGNNSGRYQTIQLVPGDVTALFLSRLTELAPLGRDYELSAWTDQPTTMLRYQQGGTEERIRIYGNLRQTQVRNQAPSVLVALYDHLVNYADPAATPWQPTYLEVILWPYDYAGDAVPWPQSWPDLNSTQSKRRQEVYSFYLPYTQKPQLDRFLKRVSEAGQAVLLDGKKWAIDTRIPFPHELPPDLPPMALTPSELKQ